MSCVFVSSTPPLLLGLRGLGTSGCATPSQRCRASTSLGQGRGRVHVGSGYVETPSADPRHLYQDVVVAIAQDRAIHNGSPSLHALCLSACEPQRGESVVHIGAGTGYYTAILSEMVGSTGSVTAFEVEPDLAARAAAALPDVAIRGESAVDAELPLADVVYVCAGVTSPPPRWLDSLKIGGRLVLPLTPNVGLGCMLLVQRKDQVRYTARSIADVAFIPCVGAGEASNSDALTSAFARRSHESIRSLRRDSLPDESAWCVGEGWWLSTVPA